MVVSALMCLQPAKAADLARFKTQPPEGFADLVAPHTVVLDVYMGGTKLGQAQATLSPAAVEFDNPALVASMLPGVDGVAAAKALNGRLDAHSSLACGLNSAADCGRVDTESAAVIVDESKFRVDVVIGQKLMLKQRAVAADLLETRATGPSILSLFGLSVGGGVQGGTQLHVQNRTIAALVNARLRMDTSIDDGQGLVVDDLVFERDQPGWRESIGAFWAPGTHLLTRRRIVGLGVQTQFDTRADKQAMFGTPITVQLARPARIALRIDGRLLAARVYAAGSQTIDTSFLPEGSYQVELEIEEQGRALRREIRFYSKNGLLAPSGHVVASFSAGLLATDDKALLPRGPRHLFYQGSLATRMSQHWGGSLSVAGTQDKAVTEAGVVFLSSWLQMNLAGLLSTAGDYGAVVQATHAQGDLSFSVDFRHVTSRNGKSILPGSNRSSTFRSDDDLDPTRPGTYSQATATASYRLGDMAFRLGGYFRSSRAGPSDYLVNASFELPLVRRQGMELRVQSDFRKERRGVSSLLGLRMQFSGPHQISVSGFAGAEREPARDVAPVGEVQASWSGAAGPVSLLSVDAGGGRDQEGSYARASASANSPVGNARFDLIHRFNGGGGTTYAATLEAGLLVSRAGVSVRGGQLSDGALSVAVQGGNDESRFALIVNGVQQSLISGHGRATVLLAPYRRYSVQLRSVSHAAHDFDASPRTVTILPGQVATESWDVTPTFVVAGIVVSSASKPLAGAIVSSSRGTGLADASGHFQVEAGKDDRLEFLREGHALCRVTLGQAKPVDGYWAAGEVRCQ